MFIFLFVLAFLLTFLSPFCLFCVTPSPHFPSISSFSSVSQPSFQSFYVDLLCVFSIENILCQMLAGNIKILGVYYIRVYRLGKLLTVSLASITHHSFLLSQSFSGSRREIHVVLEKLAPPLDLGVERVTWVKQLPWDQFGNGQIFYTTPTSLPENLGQRLCSHPPQ